MALSVIFTEKASDGINLELNLNEEFKEWEIICPNPTIADAMRTSVTRYEGAFEFETLTINKFLQDLFVQFYPEDSVVRKSELLKNLATIWKSIYPLERESFFHQAFNVFTDLRSFTLNPSLIEDILEHYDEVVASAIRVFWKVAESEGLIDEHQAYQNILNALCDPHFESHGELFSKGLILTGFTHLSGNQVELLKFIGKYTDVMIPIPAEVIRDSLKTDWVDWIKTQADHLEEYTPFNYEATLKRYTFAKGQGNLTLKSLFETQGDGNVLFIKSKIGMKEVLEVPSRKTFYKSELDLFDSVMKQLTEEIDERFLKSIGDTVASEELELFLVEKQRDFISLATKTIKDFLKIKLFGSFLKELRQWVELSEVNETLTSFDMKILIEMTQLNLPRSFNIPIVTNTNESILSLKDIYQIDLDKKNYIFVDSSHDLSIGGATQYPKDVQEILITLGPMRRKGLDLLFYISQIKEILASDNSILLIESGLDKHDPIWNNLLSEFNVLDQTEGHIREAAHSLEIEIDLSHIEKVDKLSPTRMQSYLECPRKYYYQYILKLGNEPEKVESIDSRLLGDLEHKVVQNYLKESHSWDDDIFKSLLERVLEESVLKHNENQSMYDEAYAEVNFFAKQTIMELLKLRLLDPDIQFEIEWKMQDERARGSADVIGFSKKLGPLLFDLKRSSGSIPAKSDIESLKKIQLWYYLNFSFDKNTSPEDFSLMGYINLSDPDKSLVFYQDKDILNELINVGFLSKGAFVAFKKDVSEYLGNFNELYENTLNEMNVVKSFDVLPESAASCHYCPGNAICSRQYKGGL